MYRFSPIGLKGQFESFPFFSQYFIAFTCGVIWESISDFFHTSVNSWNIVSLANSNSSAFVIFDSIPHRTPTPRVSRSKICFVLAPHRSTPPKLKCDFFDGGILPPSQESTVQVSLDAYTSCSLLQRHIHFTVK